MLQVCGRQRRQRAAAHTVGRCRWPRHPAHKVLKRPIMAAVNGLVSFCTQVSFASNVCVSSRLVALLTNWFVFGVDSRGCDDGSHRGAPSNLRRGRLRLPVHNHCLTTSCHPRIFTAPYGHTHHVACLSIFFRNFFRLLQRACRHNARNPIETLFLVHRT